MLHFATNQRNGMGCLLRRSLRPFRASVVAVLTNPSGSKYRYATCLSFTNDSNKCTNNIVEYEAIILGFCKLRALGVRTCFIKTYSKIVVGHIKKDCATQELVLLQYMSGMRSLERQFWGFIVQHIDCSKTRKQIPWRRPLQEETPYLLMCFIRSLKHPSSDTQTYKQYQLVWSAKKTGGPR